MIVSQGKLASSVALLAAFNVRHAAPMISTVLGPTSCQPLPGAHSSIVREAPSTISIVPPEQGSVDQLGTMPANSTVHEISLPMMPVNAVVSSSGLNTRQLVAAGAIALWAVWQGRGDKVSDEVETSNYGRPLVKS